MNRQEAVNGYIWRANHHWAPVYSPLQVRRTGNAILSSLKFVSDQIVHGQASLSQLITIKLG